MKIVELVIDFEDMMFDDLGVDIMSLVDKPAINVEWMAFNADVSALPPYVEEKEPTERELEGFLQEAQKDEYGIKFDETIVYIDGTKEQFETVSDVAQGIRAIDTLDNITSTPKKMYRYRGALSANSRNFCVAMVGLNKMFTRAEIDTMSRNGINGGFAERGRSTYNIFLYKGGVYCKHSWEELDVFERVGGQRVVISNGPAQGEAGVKTDNQPNRGRVNFSFSDDDKMIVTGPAMIPKELIARSDDKGNLFHVYFSEDTIRNIASKFIADNNINNTDINHNGGVVQENTLLESWIIENPKMDKSTELGFNLPKGTWMTSYKINNKETWDKIKAGELNGFSVEGSFIEKLQS